jgi:gliding motility-associated-like protein
VITKNITVKPIPKADFTFLNICDGSNMQFTNQSTIAPGSAIVSYLWDFGDGNTAATQNATHTYGDFGYFNVTLTVVSDNGCEDSYAQTVFVHPIPVSDFIVGSICEDFALPFTSTATVSGPLDHVNGWLWNFGDPGSGPSNLSSQVNPSHTYSNPGNYTVTLTVTSSNGCTHTTQKDVTIYAKPVSKFTYEKVCANERTEFTDKSLTDPATPIVSWSWDFGDGKTSTTRNPKHDYAPVGPGTYTVSLTVVTNVGCEHTLQKVITINPVPSVNFFSTAVCFGETTEFTDQSAISTGGLWSWSWDFGDNVGNSTVPNPTYTYNAPGDYRANLTVVSDSGCINNKVRTVIVHPPSPAPEIRNDTVCFGDPAFLNASISQDVTVFWYDTPGASNQPFHSGYSYVTPPLPFTTTYYVVTETDKGCRSIPYPVTGFVFSEEAVEIVTNKDIVDLPLGVVNFSTISTIPIQSWSWNFDDGNTSDLPQPIHEFENPGIYNVVVRTTDMNGCVVTIEKVIEVKRLVTLSIPSAFSPNDDGINDVFEIGHWNVERFNMQVFNRWGQMVYETNSIAFKWDGTSSTSGTPVPEGVYVYVIEAITFDNKQVKQNGTITLIR